MFNAVSLQRYIRYALSLALTSVFLLHIAGALEIPLVDSLEQTAYDARVNLRLTGYDHSDVVIIDIDETSLEALGQWPWKRDIIAAIVDTLFDHYGINTLGFDIVFAEPDGAAQTYSVRTTSDNGLQPVPTPRDTLFANSLQNRKTVLGFIFGSGIRKGSLPDSAPSLNPAAIDSIPILTADGVTANLEPLQNSARSGGFFDNPLVDDDGAYRRIPLLQLYDHRLYESLALAMARTSLGPVDLELIVRAGLRDTGPKVLEWLKIDDLLIPVDEHAVILIPYRGPQGSFLYVPAIKVLDKSVPVDELEGKIALFGTAAPGLFDLHTTPVGAAFPGVEIHANIIQGILDQTILHRPAYMTAVEFALTIILGIMLTLLGPRLPPLWNLAFTAILVALIIAADQALWSRLQLVIPIALPILFVLLMYVLHMSYGFLIEARVKHRLSHLLQQYIPPVLVEELSDRAGSSRLDGEVRQMSVLFSDIQNFTEISENMKPDHLNRMLGTVLNAVSEEIQQHQGTIDKYMGDSVMAFWGAPAEDPEHALHAVTTAMNMVRRIDSLNPELQASGWPAIRIGAGINSGAMNVGNKGSRFRVDYTVIGDAVNLGSRLEALTRVYGVDIVVGEDTREAVSGIEFRELDRVRVKGKTKPVVIYEPLGTVEAIDESRRSSLQQFSRALACYRERRWDEAEQLLNSLTQAEPHCRLYTLYLERIAQFREQPPADDWDGTFTHTSK